MSEYAEETSLAGHDGTKHQASYVFTPPQHLLNEGQGTRKRKRDSQTPLGPHEGQRGHRDLKFCSLLNGAEMLHCVGYRQRLFSDLWVHLESHVESILHNANETTLTEVTSFINGIKNTNYQGKIPTGLITTGPNIAAQDLLFGQLSQHLRVNTDSLIVVLRSGDSTNLRAVLKKLIRHVINQKEEDEELNPLSTLNDRKLLNYDLQILYDYLKAHKRTHVVIAFQDGEAFDTNLVVEMVSLLSSWIDRIPFVVLFGIATSIELFHERLPRATIYCLQGTQFDVEQTDKTLETVFREIVASPKSLLRLGPFFVKTLLERQREYVQNIQAFVSALKYAYMCHSYANPLSILLASKELDDVLQLLQPEHLEAIRILPSFRNKVESLLDVGDTRSARSLIESDEDLLETVKSAIGSRDSFVSHHLRMVDMLSILLPYTKHQSLSVMDLYVRTMTYKDDEQPFTREVLDKVKQLSAFELLDIVQAIKSSLSANSYQSDGTPAIEKHQSIIVAMSDLHARIQTMCDEAEELGLPLRSKYMPQSEALRTTVVAQKIRLKRGTSVVTEQDERFTKCVDELMDILVDLFKPNDPRDHFLHEIWLYDLRSPGREAFMSNPRQAVERALSRPHDYLGCSCCKATEGLSSSQPATAILYQLYLEGGGLINVFDLWSAFFTIVGGEDGEDCNERTALMLFYRGLADLKMLGMVKQSRKKTDHLAKLLWKDL